MRTNIFLGSCGVIAFGLMLLLAFILDYIGADAGKSNYEIVNFASVILGSSVFKVVEIGVLIPIVAYFLNPLNQKLRTWRKARGRDIEEEEKYESESGFISLTEKQK